MKSGFDLPLHTPEPAQVRLRLLVLGRLPEHDVPQDGHELELLRQISRLRATGTYELEVQDTRHRVLDGGALRRLLGRLTGAARALFDLCAAARRCDTVLWLAPARELLTAGPLVWAATRAVGTPLAVRALGGDVDLVHDRAPASWRAVCRYTVLNIPLLLLETRALCRRFHDRPGVRWLPPTRDLDDRPTIRRGVCRRFLMLGRLAPEKGVAEALAASDDLPEGCTLTLAGWEAPGFDPSRVDDHPAAEWIGRVEAEDVGRLLADHDALVYPSVDEGDGLPGSVIEALQTGLPVVAARWRAIEELVRPDENGVLVQHRSAHHLLRGMLSLVDDPEHYLALARAARETGGFYRGTIWHERLEDWIFQVCDQGMISPTLPTWERDPRASGNTPMKKSG